MRFRAASRSSIASGWPATRACFLFLLASGISEIVAKERIPVSKVYAEHRSDILDCSGVCQFRGWYFCSVTVSKEGQNGAARNRAKLEAIERIALFVERPELYDRVQNSDRVLLSEQTSYRGRFETHVLASGPVVSAGEPRFGVTVGARPVQEKGR